MLATTLFSTLASLLLATSVTPTSARSIHSLSARTEYQDPNSELVVDYPACGYYRCIFKDWTQGQPAYINWQNAPYGTVKLQLMNDYSDTNQTLAFEIGSAASPSQPGYCDAGDGLGVVVQGTQCGRFEFIVPSEWKTNYNYSVRAYLEGDESVESYTDFIQIQAASGDFALSTVAISGVPTSTDKSGSGSSFTGTYTAPTVVGEAVSSSASSSSGSSTSSGTTAAPTSASDSSSSAAAASTSSAAQATASAGTSAAASSRHLGAGVLLAGLSSLMAVVGGVLLL
ncbi:hypothetical protein BCV69DRAFT_285194 [Microstroma glucosiphilum]|uniref:Uncharacterized protein n=1 Tax=Pseudomicrostroma glucosiphilum TaxID=1684307 RepID=A0A316TZZ2_9BASI|nr:hypothetical protein BCV69DRAFT_285194 [Pseudomicrostroma glucosiphilum]PWN18214.1 hypothetical protein BCV69DRAFT_285194 [Pseudomicrostroma glucosiphilum]